MNTNIVYSMVVYMKGSTDFVAYSRSKDALLSFKEKLEKLEHPLHLNKVDGAMTFVSSVAPNVGFNISWGGYLDMNSFPGKTYLKKIGLLEGDEVGAIGWKVLEGGEIEKLMGPFYLNDEVNPLYKGLTIITPSLEAAILADLKTSKESAYH